MTAENLLDHFNSAYGGTDERSQQQEPDLDSVTDSELDSEITETEIKNAVFSQKNNKSSGIDNLCAELFKCSYDIISPFLVKLFNRLFSNGEYPMTWAEGIIVPIFKSGNPDEPHNYRGITLINILGKIYSQVLLNRLTKWSENYDKISKLRQNIKKPIRLSKRQIYGRLYFCFSSIISKVLSSGDKLYCIFLDYEKAKDVEIIHTMFCRRILNVKISTHLCGLYGELGRIPLKIQRKLNILKYWIKLLKLQQDSVPKKINLLLKDDANKNLTYNGSNWAFQIKSILESIGLAFIWYNQLEMDIPFSLIKQRIMDMYYQSWYSDINNSNGLITYCRYKHDFAFENYLDVLKENKYRVALTRFRLSSHDLNIEQGRYDNVPRHERICKCCRTCMNVVDTKYPFLLVCPLYRELRLKYFKQYLCHWPNIYKFDSLMMSKTKSTILNLASFVYFASKLRKQVCS